MLLTVFCVPRDRAESTFALDVSPELELSNFVALCELESGIPAGEIQITYAEQPLRDLAQALGNYGLKDGDVVVLRQVERRPAAQPNFPGLPRIDFSSIAVPGTSSNQQPTIPAQPPQPAPTPQAASPTSSPQGLDNPALLRDMLLANPHELSLLKERNPPLAEALLSGDLERFTKVLLEQQQDRAKRDRERIRLITADPFDLEAQAKIEEDIRQHNIEENMTIAMEEAPESFGQVVMLYINCKVNGHPVKAFVDSGAQMTIMSQACAERCNIMRLVDRRWAGIAKGVGTQKIIGRVHLAQVQIEGDFLPCSFSILEDQPMDMLLGLDMLKRHQCSIDLKKNVLLIGTTGTETSFLPEAELPDCARLAYGPEGREEARPEELADRELAEALHRSIQDSDTADGTTTSPESPPLSFCKNLNTPSSSATSQKPGFKIDRSKSAPASIDPSFTPVTSCGPFEPEQKTQHGIVTEPDHSTSTESSPTLKIAETPQGPANEQISSFEPESQPVTDSLSFAHQTSDDFPPVLPAQEPFSFTVSNENDVAKLVTCGEPRNAFDREQDITVQEAEQTTLNSVDANLLTETCIQEMDLSSPEPCSNVENAVSLGDGEISTFTEQKSTPSDFEENIGASAVRKNSINQEKEQAEGNCIPSLAQALKELHKLLMSNAQAPSAHHSQNAPAQASASFNPTADLSSHTASEATIAKLESEARLNVTAVDGSRLGSQGLDDSPTNGFSSSSSLERDGENVAGADSQAEGEKPSLHCHQGDAELTVVSPPLDSVESSLQHPACVSGAGSSLMQTESSCPSTQGDPSLSQDPTHGSTIGLYPTEHVQRIQAAGFTSFEATEALEQAEGSVELALLLLLARKITVPT